MIDRDIIESYVVQHMNACEVWEHGSVKEIWIQDGELCIRYQDDTWYHYRETANGLEWW